QQATAVRRLEPVDVRAVAVHLGADRVPGAVHEAVGEAGVGDHLAHDGVDVAAADRPTRAHRVAHGFDAGIARATHDVEDARVARGDARADVSGPRDIGVHARRLLGPQVDENEVAGSNRGALTAPWLVMWIGAVRTDGNDRRVMCHQTAGAKL